VFVASVLLVACVGCGTGSGQPSTSQANVSLRLYCGAGLRPPVDEIAMAFQQKHGIKIECDYAGSEVLLSKLKHSKEGDLYMPGDAHYVDQAAAEGMVVVRTAVASQEPVILVKKGNPKGLKSLHDFARPGLNLALGDGKACAIGKSTLALLKKNGLDLQAVEKNKVYNGMTVSELALQVKLGQADASVVWDATAKLFADQTDTIQIPAAQNIISIVPVATLSFSQHADSALKFLEFVRSEESRRIFERHGYSAAPQQETSR
jgi:molybdate transport system substrate-binding protein